MDDEAAFWIQIIAALAMPISFVAVVWHRVSRQMGMGYRSPGKVEDTIVDDGKYSAAKTLGVKIWRSIPGVKDLFECGFPTDGFWAAKLG